VPLANLTSKDKILVVPGSERERDEIISVRLNLERQFRGSLDSVAADRELVSLKAQLKSLGVADQNHLCTGADIDATPSDLATRYAWIIDQIQRITIALETGEPTTLTFFEREVQTVTLQRDIELETGTKLANVFLRCGCLSKELLTQPGAMSSFLDATVIIKPNHHRDADVGRTLTYAQVAARPPTLMPMSNHRVYESSIRPANNPIETKAREHAGIPVNTPATNILGVQFLLVLFSLFQSGIKDIKKGPARKLRTLYYDWTADHCVYEIPIMEAEKAHLNDFLKYLTKNPIQQRNFDIEQFRKVDVEKLNSLMRLDEDAWFVKEYKTCRDPMDFTQKVLKGDITEANAINSRMNGKEALAHLLQIHERIDVPVNNGKLTDEFEKTLKGLKKYLKNGKWEKVEATKSARRTLTSLWVEKKAMIMTCLKYVPLNTQLMAYISRYATITSMIAGANILGQTSYLDRIHKDNFTVFPMLKKNARLYLKDKSGTWNEKITVLEKALTDEQLDKLRVSTKTEGKAQQRRARKDKRETNPAQAQSAPTTSEDDKFLSFISGTPQGVCAFYFNGHQCRRKACKLLHSGPVSPTPRPRPPRSQARNNGNSNVPPPVQPSQGVPPTQNRSNNMDQGMEERIFQRVAELLKLSQGHGPTVPQGNQQPKAFTQYNGTLLPVY